MRFQSGHAEVHAEGFGQSAGFSILASGKAFKGLIDGIYSRKVEAAIRELATNAFDSHKAAGSIAPFDVHLPTALRPTFWLRDYGTGMSHDFIMNRFTVMFDSTKDGVRDDDQQVITADEQVGMLGLGRMSFFAYTDGCTLSNWRDGEVNHYTVFMGPDGVPRVAHAGSAPSDEPNGVKVEFPVKTKDFGEFERAAMRVFKGFPVAPTGLPIKVKEALAIEPVEIGSFWKAYPKDYLPDSGFYARQGCVLYPIDLAQIDERAVEIEEHEWDYRTGQQVVVTKMDLSEKFARFKDMKLTLVMDFPIGSLEFDLSRERLAYNDRSVLALRARWAEFIADLDTVLREQFEAQPSPWDRMALASADMFKDLGVLFKQSSYFAEADSLYENLRDEIADSRRDRCPEYAIYSIIKNTGGTNPSVIYALDQSGAPGKAISPDIAKSVFIYRDDVKAQGVNRRINQYLQQEELVFGFIIEQKMLTPDFFKKVGRPKIVRLSELPPLPKRQGGGGNLDGPPPFERIKIIDDNGHTYRGATEDDDLDGYVFAFLNRGYAHNPDPEKYPHVSADEIMKMHAALKYFTGRSIAFINVKSNEFGKLKEKYADYPLFYGCLEGVRDMINTKDLRDLVNLINWERFEGTKYHQAMNLWVDSWRDPSDPLSDMRRFKFRYDRVQNPRRYLLSSFIDGGIFSAFRDEIIERGKAIGLEVLPPMERLGPYHSSSRFYPYPLLPKKWEELVRLINRNARLHKDDRRFVYTAMKEKLGC